MANLPPEDLSREISRLWARLGSVSAEPAAAPPPPTGGSELAWETVEVLKKQQRRREAAIAAALESKEQALDHWRRRAEALQREALELRGKVEGGDERAFAELLDAQQKLQDAARALALERENRDDERRRFEATLEEMRTRLAAEAQRARDAEARWTKREAQSLADLKDLQQAAERRQKEAAQADESVRALKGGLAEAKNALEKTLAELLLERRERQRVEEERAKAAKKAEEAEAHFNELQKIWDEERAQWRELWDRERSTWETQRQELAQWEETLRREREAWHAELQDKEKLQLSYTETLSGKLRETHAAADAVAERMRSLETREAREAALRKNSELRAAQAAAEKRASTVRGVRWAAAALAAVVIAVSAKPAARWALEWRWAPEASAPVPAANPTALAFDGGHLWVADWSGRVVEVDPADPRRALREVNAPAGGPYRPTALAFGGGVLWSLDAAQARILRARSDKPTEVIATRPSPGPAPTALAFDGSSLWSYDAANRSLYRHGGDEAAHKSYALSEDVVPNALAWVGGRLWLHDTKSRRFLVYAVEGDALVLRESHAAPEGGLLGFVVGGEPGDRRVWTLAAPSPERGQAALQLYRLRRRIRFADF